MAGFGLGGVEGEREPARERPEKEGAFVERLGPYFVIYRRGSSGIRYHSAGREREKEDEGVRQAPVEF